MGNWFKRFPFVFQLDSNDCGIACIKMIARYYRRPVPDLFYDYSNINAQGISIHNLKKIAEKAGFHGYPVSLPESELKDNIALPTVLLWNQKHFVVLYKIKNEKYYVADPGLGYCIYNKLDFLKSWAPDESAEGILLALEPDDQLTIDAESETKHSKLGFLLTHFRRFKYPLGLVFAGLLIGIILELLFPLLSKKLIDTGIQRKNVPVLLLIFLFQLGVSGSKMAVGFIRSWIYVHVSSRLSIYMISEFLETLIQLPLFFFASKKNSDLILRIRDHNRIENFITEIVVKSLLAMVTILPLAALLFYYNHLSLLIFSAGAILQFLLIPRSLFKIQRLEKSNISLQSTEQYKLYEIVYGINDIKLNNLAAQKKNEWQDIQKSLFAVNTGKLKVNQSIEAYSLINNILLYCIGFSCALAVVSGQLTLGAFFAVSFIVSQLNMNVIQLTNFLVQWEYTKISIERVQEIHKQANRLKDTHTGKCFESDSSIYLKNVSFSYIDRSDNRKALNDITLRIPAGKTTAVVGISGSGKTTLLKLLLKFYDANSGEIRIGGMSLQEADTDQWRSRCGVVMQDSYIFSDTIAYNISLEATHDEVRLAEAIRIANLGDFISGLPLGVHTKIGYDGWGMSGGQKQRVLIARVVYKNPDYLFFDEATNALDTENESLIMQNLHEFFVNKTVLIIAHRLSTVKNADQIVVLGNGGIIETGSHEILVKNKGKYHGLIKNQLELGN